MSYIIAEQRAKRHACDRRHAKVMCEHQRFSKAGNSETTWNIPEQELPEHYLAQQDSNRMLLKNTAVRCLAVLKHLRSRPNPSLHAAHMLSRCGAASDREAQASACTPTAARYVIIGKQTTWCAVKPGSLVHGPSGSTKRKSKKSSSCAARQPQPHVAARGVRPTRGRASMDG